MRHLLAIVSLTTIVAAQSSFNWITNPANGRQYALTDLGTWHQAEAQAVAHGAHLATVRNAAENAWLLQTFGAGDRFLGLTDEAQEGTWVWVSGEPVTYTNWDSGQPNSQGGNEDYCLMWTSGYWHDYDQEIYRGIAEMTGPPAGYQWFQSPTNGHYYSLTPALGWQQAETLAASLGAHLVTIRSSAEQAWLNQTFGTVGWWIGYSDAVLEGSWVWTSGEPTTYTDWCPGEPNNASNEDFANSGSCGWNDVEDAILIPGIMELASPVAAYATFGTGCLGPSGVAPLLAGLTAESPRLGTTSHIRVSNLPLTVTVPIFVLGLSNTQDPGPPSYSLPADLGPLGWPGCQQLISDDVIDFAITTSGQADYMMAVPNNLTLVGFTFYAQAFVLYSPSGVAVSNGLTGTVGY